MKVFYSWQSDTPTNAGRTFIRRALEAAVAGLELEDAERIDIDQDTAGVLGSPVVADTIFRKIREATVVISDVTLTSQTPGGKRACNSNVAIELGYALGIRGDEVLLKVMNTYYGLAKDLPFDLAHRRWPVQFRLSPDASPGEHQATLKALSKELGQILRQYAAADRDRNRIDPEQKSVPGVTAEVAEAFNDLVKLIPDFLKVMKQDIEAATGKLARDIYICHRPTTTLIADKAHFRYHLSEHDQLLEKVSMISRAGLLLDKTTGHTPHYVLTEPLVKLLKGWIAPA